MLNSSIFVLLPRLYIVFHLPIALVWFLMNTENITRGFANDDETRQPKYQAKHRPDTG